MSQKNIDHYFAICVAEHKVLLISQHQDDVERAQQLHQKECGELVVIAGEIKQEQ